MQKNLVIFNRRIKLDKRISNIEVEKTHFSGKLAFFSGGPGGEGKEKSMKESQWKFQSWFMEIQMLKKFLNFFTFQQNI